MKKKYLIFDLDGTLTPSQSNNEKTILEYLSSVKGTDLEKAKYIFHHYTGLSVLEQLEMLYEDNNSIDYQEITQGIYSELNKNNADIFPGVKDLLIKLSKSFVLLLSTGSSDDFAKKTLKNGGIYDLFDVVMGSSVLLKGTKHIETFQLVSNDNDFIQKSVFIGDGEGDKIIAEKSGIPFIKIGKNGKNKYEIDSVLEVEDLIKKIR